MNNFCNKPDRDVPKLICGYPLPCPYHTIMLDVEKGDVEVPENLILPKRTRRRVIEVSELLKKP